MDEINLLIDNHFFIKPEYLNHPYVSGNKLRKLKYNLMEAKKKNKAVLTMSLIFLNRLTINSLRKQLIKEIT